LQTAFENRPSLARLTLLRWAVDQRQRHCDLHVLQALWQVPHQLYRHRE